jgi:hypothetical protein
MRLEEIVAGLPFYHILQKDPDRELLTTRKLLDRYRGRFRLMSNEERDRLRMGFARHAYIPDIKPLGRPATPDDVKAGSALFELNGKGRTADLRLPAWMLLKTEAGAEYPSYGLVVQAEVGADGKILYGVVLRHAIRTVRAEEVERIESHRKE